MLKAKVVSSTRRFVQILTEDNKIIPGMLVSKDLSSVVGDLVLYNLQPEKAEALIETILARRNILSRAAINKTKELVANVDLLIIVAAPNPLFNRTFIDRVIATAKAQNIEAVLLINKVDLKQELAKTLVEIEVYQQIGINVIYANTIEEDGLAELQKIICNPQLNIVSLVGISGVGKSSIINKLCPDDELRIDDVSSKSGQGKQTTTVAQAYRYPKNSNLLLVDLPGIQNFGVMHLCKEELLLGFPEILAQIDQCKFNDCSHQKEPGCGVKKALENGEIDQVRYQSYLSLKAELDEMKPY